MASSREYLQFVLDQCPGEVTYRAMMGEYLLYYRGKLFGGIYDDRMLVKMVSSALELLPDAARELPYEGAKPMLLVDRLEDRVFLEQLLNAMYEQLPVPLKKKK